MDKKIDDLSDEDSGDDSGGAGEEKCPPKPATITPFNATKVSDFWLPAACGGAALGAKIGLLFSSFSSSPRLLPKSYLFCYYSFA